MNLSNRRAPERTFDQNWQFRACQWSLLSRGSTKESWLRRPSNTWYQDSNFFISLRNHASHVPIKALSNFMFAFDEEVTDFGKFPQTWTCFLVPLFSLSFFILLSFQMTSFHKKVENKLVSELKQLAEGRLTGVKTKLDQWFVSQVSYTGHGLTFQISAIDANSSDELWYKWNKNG